MSSCNGWIYNGMAMNSVVKCAHTHHILSLFHSLTKLDYLYLHEHPIHLVAAVRFMLKQPNGTDCQKQKRQMERRKELTTRLFQCKTHFYSQYRFLAQYHAHGIDFILNSQESNREKNCVFSCASSFQV